MQFHVIFLLCDSFKKDLQRKRNKETKAPPPKTKNKKQDKKQTNKQSKAIKNKKLKKPQKQKQKIKA